jgi:hypothetical protein
MKVAAHPFHFVTASYLTRIGNHKASTLAELSEGLELCSDASIFYVNTNCLVIHLGHRDEHSAAGKKRHEFNEHRTSFSWHMR